ncbi:MAG: glycosyltransferase [Thermoplasmatota archaeon]
MDAIKEEVRNSMDVDPPSISLVVPCYMRDREDADKLERLLSSAFKQTLPFDSVIIVDDGSEFPPERPSGNAVLVGLRKNSGPARARNVGMEEALKRGSGIIFFTDHDCILDPEWSSRLVDFMKINSVQAAGGITLSYGNTLIDEFHDRNRTLNGLLRPPDNRYLDYQPTCNFAITDRIAREFKFDENFTMAAGEDVDYCLRVGKKYNIGYCEDAIVHHDYGYRNFISGTRSFIRMFKRYRESLHILFALHPDHFGQIQKVKEPLHNRVVGYINNILYLIKNILHFLRKVERISRIPPFLILKGMEQSISYWYEPRVGLFRNYKHELTYQMTWSHERGGPKFGTCGGPENERIPVETVLKAIRNMARYLSRVTVRGESPRIFSGDVLSIATLTAELGIPMTVTAHVDPPKGKFLSEMKRLKRNLVVSSDMTHGEKSIGTDCGNAPGMGANCSGIAGENKKEHAPHEVRSFAWLNIIILPDGGVVKCFDHCGQDPLGNLKKDDMVSILSTRQANRIMRELKR